MFVRSKGEKEATPATKIQPARPVTFNLGDTLRCNPIVVVHAANMVRVWFCVNVIILGAGYAHVAMGVEGESAGYTSTFRITFL